VLEVRGVAQRGIVEQINFTLHKGETLGVFGLMGSGRTELARILFGMDRPRTGRNPGKRQTAPTAVSPRRSIDTGMAFVTENRREEGLLMDISISQQHRPGRPAALCCGHVSPLARKRYFDQIAGVADSLKIKAGDVRQQAVKTLSGGNQQKAVIGKWLLDKPPC
jgi:ribose transport system ATP-binding protein